MKQFFLTALLICLAATTAQAKTFDEMFPQFAADFPADARTKLAGFDYKQGRVFLGEGIATLDVPEGYYFLAKDNAETVLFDLWKNPRNNETLGMIFPADGTPLHGNVWGIQITFEAIGYVSDEDAVAYDYDELLKGMQRDTVENNKWRRQNNFDEVTLVGWAVPPRYDVQGRKLYWAKEFKVAGTKVNTLNYNIRALGRKGVLVLNFVASIDELVSVQASVPDVLAMTNFTPGNAYSDFNPSIDKVAAIGIGGLIAGKVLAKAGFLAFGLVLFKKFWFLVLLPLLWLKKLIFRKKDPQ